MSIYGNNLLLEAINDDAKTAGSKLYIIYLHLVKWKYQKERRGSSWCNSIIDKSREIYKICYDKKKKKFNKNIVSILINNSKDIFDSAFIGAMKEINKSYPIEYEIYNLFNTIESITDENYIKEYMLSDETRENIRNIVIKK